MIKVLSVKNKSKNWCSWITASKIYLSNTMIVYQNSSANKASINETVLEIKNKESTTQNPIGKLH